MTAPPLVTTIVDALLAAIDAEAPGLLTGFYLTGSAVLGDFRPHTSDIDFVAVTDTRPDASALAALERAHHQIRRRFPLQLFDGAYATWQDLVSDPARAEPGPSCRDGRFYSRGNGGACNPVTWHIIAHHGIAYRGPARPNIWTDPDALACWTLDNLKTYWRRFLDRASRPLHPIAYSPYGTIWIVLGVTRLHYTLATGDIVSKESAGCYGLQIFPPLWHRILHESLRIRRADRARPDLLSTLADVGGSLYRTPIARRRDALNFGNMVIADAERQHSTAGHRTIGGWL